MQINPELVALLRSERISIALTISLGFLGGISAVVFAWLMSRTINAVFVNGQLIGDVSTLLAGMGLAAIMRALAQGGSEYTAGRLAIRIKSGLRMRLLEHLFVLGPAYARGERGEQDVRTGELTNSLTDGVEALDAYFSQYLPQIALAALIPLGILVFIFPLDPLSALLLLLTAPLIPVFMILIGSTADAINRRQWLSLSRLSAYILDVLLGLSTLKLMGRSREQISKLSQLSEQVRATTMNVLRVTFLSALALELLTMISTAVVAVQVGLRLLYGHLGFEEAFFVLLLAPEFYLPLRMLGTRFHAGMSGTAAAKRIFQILDVKVDPGSLRVDPLNGTGRIEGDLQFNDVSVRYSDGRVALEDICFEIRAGSRTVLVGESGAGKSTVAGVMLGFIEPEGGEIRMNGICMGSMPVDAWRESIAWVSQESYLFNDSVSANIQLGRPQASRKEVEEAARLANAHDFIQTLPEGYDTRIGEHGMRLSAGQAQRIALARAFLKDAPVLILDEPSAHLDAGSEALVMGAIVRLTRGRTTLIISHRLNTIHPGDQIILLDEGKVAASGTHQELLVSSDAYRRLVEASGGMGDTLSGIVIPSQEANLSVLDHSHEETAGKKVGPLDILKRLIGFLSPYKWRVFLSVFLGWATVMSGVGLMATSAYIIAKAALHPPIAELQVAIVGVRFFGISRGLFRYLERLISHDLTLRILASLRVWLYRAIEPLVPARLGAYRSGDLLKRMTGDIASLESLYVRGVAPPLVAVLVSITIAVYLSSFSMGLAILFILFVIAGGLGLPWIVSLASQQAGKESIRAQGEMSAAIVDGLQGLADLLSFGAARRYQQHVAGIQSRLTRAQVKLARIGSAQTAVLGLLGQLATLAVLSTAIGLGGAQLVDGLYLGVIALVVLTSFDALQPLPQAAQVLGSSLEAADRLFIIANTPPAVEEPPIPRLPGERLELEVCDLCFNYPAGRKLGILALHSISFRLPHGKHMAIVGPSGAGKSTLVRLLTRSWDYKTGSILIDGSELSEYAGDGIRKKIAVVPQSPYLFTATIMDNLRISRPDAGKEEIIQAAKLAHIHDFIQGLPEGYQTWVGEHGLRLSAGERQRIAVARALLMDAPLLVLDEATANLDAVTERKVMTAIFSSRQGRSLLVISHRLVGMEKFDEILVLDGGRVVEQGKHAELLAGGGTYRYLWENQQVQGFSVPFKIHGQGV